MRNWNTYTSASFLVGVEWSKGEQDDAPPPPSQVFPKPTHCRLACRLLCTCHFRVVGMSAGRGNGVSDFAFSASDRGRPGMAART